MPSKWFSYHPPHCAWGQNKHGSSSRQVCNSSSCFELPSIALTVDMGIFRQVAIFYSHSLTYEAQHTFPSFDFCVSSYLSHVDVWIREYGLCHLIFTPQWNRKSWITAWKFLNTLINFKNVKYKWKKCFSYNPIYSSLAGAPIIVEGVLACYLNFWRHPV